MDHLNSSSEKLNVTHKQNNIFKPGARRLQAGARLVS